MESCAKCRRVKRTTILKGKAKVLSLIGNSESLKTGATIITDARLQVNR